MGRECLASGRSHIGPPLRLETQSSKQGIPCISSIVGPGRANNLVFDCELLLCHPTADMSPAMRDMAIYAMPLWTNAQNICSAGIEVFCAMKRIVAVSDSRAAGQTMTHIFEGTKRTLPCLRRGRMRQSSLTAARTRRRFRRVS